MRPYEQERNFSFNPQPDHRWPWIHKADTPPKNAVQLINLLTAYLSVHGDWREISADGRQSWEFTPCECLLCQTTSHMINHPERPYVK